MTIAQISPASVLHHIRAGVRSRADLAAEFEVLPSSKFLADALDELFTTGQAWELFDLLLPDPPLKPGMWLRLAEPAGHPLTAWRKLVQIRRYDGPRFDVALDFADGTTSLWHTDHFDRFERAETEFRPDLEES